MSISTFSLDSHSAALASVKPLAAALGRWLLVVMMAAGVLAAGYAPQLALETPGQVIRHDLTRAAARVARLPSFMPSERVEQTVSRYFPGYRGSVDATGFPASVSVTLRDVDPDACRDVYRKAVRIEGEVVIAIEGNGDRTCRHRTAITWRIMP